jgi:hypothetical protein
MSGNDELAASYSLLNKQMSNIARELDQVMVKHKNDVLGGPIGEPTDPGSLAARHLVRKKVEEILTKVQDIERLVGSAPE